MNINGGTIKMVSLSAGAVVAAAAAGGALRSPVPPLNTHVNERVQRVQHQQINSGLQINTMQRSQLRGELNALDIQLRSNPSPDALPLITARKQQIEDALQESERERQSIERLRKQFER